MLTEGWLWQPFAKKKGTFNLPSGYCHLRRNSDCPQHIAGITAGETRQSCRSWLQQMQLE